MRYFSILFHFFPFLLVLGTALIVDNNLANGVVSSKYFWFYGSMGLVAVATVIYSSINKPVFRFSITDGFVLLFAVSVFLSSCVINDASANATKITLLALLLVLYLCLRLVQGVAGQVRNDREDKGVAGQARNDRKDRGLRVKPAMTSLSLFCVFIILTGLVEAVWGLLQLYGFQPSQHGLFKLTGSFFNPGPYAGYLAVVFPMALHFGLTGNRQPVADPVTGCLPPVIRKVLGGITCVLTILVLPAAMSRAAWLAAIAGSAIVLIKNYELGIRNFFATRHLSPVTRHLSLFAVATVALALLIGLYYLKKDSADGRLLTWKVSLTALVKHPLGVGLGHFPSAYNDVQAAYFASGKASETEEYVAGNPEYGFNEFLQIAVESGIVSLLLFIGILVSAFRGVLKTKNWGVMGSLVALLVFSCFSYPFSVLPFLILFVFLLAMSSGTQIAACHCGRSEAKTRNPMMRRLRVKPAMTENTRGFRVKRGMTIISVICFISVLLALWKQFPVYKAYKQWKNNQMLYQVGLYKDAAKGYEPLYPYLNDQIQFLFEYGRSLSQAGVSDSRGIAGQARNDKGGVGDPESSSARHDRLIESNRVLQQATQISCDPMLYNIMGKNYQALKEYDLAEKSLLKSTHIVPNRLYPYYLLMKLYVETGDEIKASEAAGIVLAKEPKVQSQAVKEMREEARRIRN